MLSEWRECCGKLTLGFPVALRALNAICFWIKYDLDENTPPIKYHWQLTVIVEPAGLISLPKQFCRSFLSGDTFCQFSFSAWPRTEILKHNFAANIVPLRLDSFWQDVNANHFAVG